MKRISKFHCNGLILSLCLLPLAALADSIDDASHQLQSISSQISQLNERLNKDKQSQSSEQQLLRDVEIQIGQVKRHLFELDKRIQEQENRRQQLLLQQDRLHQRLEQQRKGLAEQVRAAYIMGRQERLKVMLNQGDINRISRMLSYYEYFNRERLQKISDSKLLLAQLRQNRMAIEQQSRQLTELHSHEKNSMQQLTAAQQTRQQVITELQQRISSSASSLDKLQQDKAALEQLLQQLQQSLAAIPTESLAKPFKKRRGHLPWPAKGRLSARFGSAREGGIKWDGVLIETKDQTRVKAIHHGQVVFADWLRGFGLMLIIDHGDGFMTLYGHNETLLKDTGDWVDGGEIIAGAGNSGGRQKIAVYFGIRHNGSPVNPKKWCLPIKRNRITMTTRIQQAGAIH
ncbi:MAG: peptidoglycan DD-metalloendopeptidase family protein [gamma proteobacterium symbiont of Bathyaustriella thionipta]|nr:peptidoglycan DD-metalloendopeptidase family protein [gamma proteobacterium symbiont of Bathyaustriella thionipta]